MNAPSRRILPSPKPQAATLATWIFLAGIVACLTWGVVTSEAARWVFGCTVVLMVTLMSIDRIRLRCVRAERKEESICSFARSLPARAHDTGIVRAVYEELSRVFPAPLRPSDKVERFYGIVGEDLDDVAFRVAHRAGRSMEGAEKNPLFGHIMTVADMVRFFEAQPKLPNQSPEPTPLLVTPRADARVAPSKGVAHL